MSRSTKPGLPDGDPRHGTVNGYNNLGCSCAACRAAWNERVKQRALRRGVAQRARSNRDIHREVHTEMNGGTPCGPECSWCEA